MIAIRSGDAWCRSSSDRIDVSRRSRRHRGNFARGKAGEGRKERSRWTRVHVSERFGACRRHCFVRVRRVLRRGASAPPLVARPGANPVDLLILTRPWHRASATIQLARANELPRNPRFPIYACTDAWKPCCVAVCRINDSWFAPFAPTISTIEIQWGSTRTKSLDEARQGLSGERIGWIPIEWLAYASNNTYVNPNGDESWLVEMLRALVRSLKYKQMHVSLVQRFANDTVVYTSYNFTRIVDSCSLPFAYVVYVLRKLIFICE